jgi:hypothetical protein
MHKQTIDAAREAHFIAYYQARRRENEEYLCYAETRTGPVICQVTQHGEIDATDAYKQGLRDAIEDYQQAIDSFRRHT